MLKILERLHYRFNMLKKAKELPHYVKDTKTGAILNTDNNALQAYRKKREAQERKRREAEESKKIEEEKKRKEALQASIDNTIQEYKSKLSALEKWLDADSKTKQEHEELTVFCIQREDESLEEWSTRLKEFVPLFERSEKESQEKTIGFGNYKLRTYKQHTKFLKPDNSHLDTEQNCSPQEKFLTATAKHSSTKNKLRYIQLETDEEISADYHDGFVKNHHNNHHH